MCDQCGDLSHVKLSPLELKALQASLGFYSKNGEPVIIEVNPSNSKGSESSVPENE